MSAPRFGIDDERGAYNLIDSQATLRGLAAVQTGKVLSLGLEIVGGSRGPAAEMRPPVQHFMTRDGGDYAAGLPERGGFGFADDVIMMATQGSTHIDALAHVWCGGQMYNGFRCSEVTSKGAARCGIDKVGPIATRAIFVDLAREIGRAPEPGFAYPPELLIDAVNRDGLKPEPGDALVVRTGWLAAWRGGQTDTLTSVGLHHDCAKWILECGFSLVAADNVAVEVLPSRDPGCAVPLHISLIRDNGVYLAELLDLEELAALRRSSFMLVVAPLRLKGGTGSPVAPVAIV